MTATARTLDAEIDQQRNKIRTDKLDVSYGELASMYEKGELIVDPTYQRLFRWDLSQQTKFVESLLLGFPIPAIFVAETDQGVWELVDGLQRISTVLGFLGVRKGPEGALCEPTVLCDEEKRRMPLPSLNGMEFEHLSLRSQLTIKRASCRVEVIKVGSAPRMKYEVFERLNTGGESLTPQEVRNCIFRAQAPDFMDFVDELADFVPFKESLNLSEFQESSMFDRGLVLRFFTLKNRWEKFEHDVEPFITDYIRGIVEEEEPFARDNEGAVFRDTFRLITDALADDSWRHYRGGKHKGPFSVYVFDALSVGVARNIEAARLMGSEEIGRRCIELKQESGFVLNTGAGANIKSRMVARMQAAIQVFQRS